jgi:hemolysin III
MEVFHVLDHCAIYILIAGSYTPFLLIPFPTVPFYSVHLLAAMWAACFGGIFTEAFHHAPYPYP